MVEKKSIWDGKNAKAHTYNAHINAFSDRNTKKIVCVCVSMWQKKKQREGRREDVLCLWDNPKHSVVHSAFLSEENKLRFYAMNQRSRRLFALAWILIRYISFAILFSLTVGMFRNNNRQIKKVLYVLKMIASL